MSDASGVSVVLESESTSELAEAISLLLPQLSKSSTEIDENALSMIMLQNGVDLFTARLDGKIVGTLTLVTDRLLTGLRSFIEDVVVDSSCRGKGVGESLVRSGLERAEYRGAKTVDLTSRPDREAANRLYLRCGFELRKTNIYRFTIK